MKIWREIKLTSLTRWGDHHPLFATAHRRRPWPAVPCHRAGRTRATREEEEACKRKVQALLVPFLPREPSFETALAIATFTASTIASGEDAAHPRRTVVDRRAFAVVVAPGVLVPQQPTAARRGRRLVLDGIAAVVRAPRSLGGAASAASPAPARPAREKSKSFVPSVLVEKRICTGAYQGAARFFQPDRNQC